MQGHDHGRLLPGRAVPCEWPKVLAVRSDAVLLDGLEHARRLHRYAQWGRGGADRRRWGHVAVVLDGFEHARRLHHGSCGKRQPRVRRLASDPALGDCQLQHLFRRVGDGDHSAPGGVLASQGRFTDPNGTHGDHGVCRHARGGWWQRPPRKRPPDKLAHRAPWWPWWPWARGDCQLRLLPGIQPVLLGSPGRRRSLRHRSLRLRRGFVVHYGAGLHQRLHGEARGGRRVRGGDARLRGSRRQQLVGAALAVHHGLSAVVGRPFVGVELWKPGRGRVAAVLRGWCEGKHLYTSGGFSAGGSGYSTPCNSHSSLAAWSLLVPITHTLYTPVELEVTSSRPSTTSPHAAPKCLSGLQ